MRHEQLYLRDIVEAYAAIESFLENARPESFLHDELLQSAVLQKLIMIGEAATHVSAELQARTPAIAWREAIGFRNFAVHAYFAMDWHVVWATATVDARRLASQVAELTDGRFPPAQGPSQ